MCSDGFGVTRLELFLNEKLQVTAELNADVLLQ